MKKLLLLMALIGMAAGGHPVKIARSPKDVATGPTNRPTMMVPKQTAPSFMQPSLAVIITNRPPPRAPWVVSKTLQFDPVPKAVGYSFRCTTNEGVWPAFRDLGTNTIFTLTNIPPRRAVWVEVAAYDANHLMTPAGKSVIYLEVQNSTWISNGRQFYGYRVPPNHIIQVDAESILNGTKRHVVSMTNIDVLVLDEPIQATDFFIITIKPNN